MKRIDFIVLSAVICYKQTRLIFVNFWVRESDRPNQVVKSGVMWWSSTWSMSMLILLKLWGKSQLIKCLNNRNICFCCTVRLFLIFYSKITFVSDRFYLYCINSSLEFIEVKLFNCWTLCAHAHGIHTLDGKIQNLNQKENLSNLNFLFYFAAATKIFSLHLDTIIVLTTNDIVYSMWVERLRAKVSYPFLPPAVTYGNYHEYEQEVR